MSTVSHPHVPALELEEVDIPSPIDPDVAVVREVSWQVAEGDTWLVAGPPASGKSSVLSVAAGLVRPTRGRLRVFGRDLARLSESEQADSRAQVGVVFGSGGRLFPALTVAENLALPLQYHELGSERDVLRRVEEVLSVLGLLRHADRPARELPRRIAQRVALARALALRPAVLLLDDPVVHLMPREAEWWTDFAWRAAVDQGIRTFVVASQDLHPWSHRARRFAILVNREWRIAASAAEAEEGLHPALTE